MSMPLLQVPIEKKTHSRLKRVAKQTDLSMCQIARAAIERAIDEMELKARDNDRADIAQGLSAGGEASGHNPVANPPADVGTVAGTA